MKPISFELKSQIEYASGNGGEIETNLIELREPTGKVSYLCCDIESLIQAGILKMSEMIGEDTINQAKEDAKAVEKIEDSGPSEESVMAIMTGGGVDMKKVVLLFRELFREVAFVGAEKPMTKPLMDRMTHKDFRRMMGVYAANFILD